MSDKKAHLDSLFEAAIGIESAEERAAFIEHKCGDDDRLREQLEQLLASDQQAGSFLEGPPAEFEATLLEQVGEDFAGALEAGFAPAFGRHEAVVMGNANHSVLRSLSNSLVEVPNVSLRESNAAGDDPIARPNSPEMPKSNSDSRYQLQGEIARGGMGVIIKGRDVDLGRDLAIKVLLDEYSAKPDVIQRFVEEAQIGGQLQHPGIAPIYELGQFADKRPYFAMKLVKGETLSKLLKERENPTEDRGKFLGIFEQVCQTMAYAHSRGVIHRDLKPANIMVGAFGEVQVVDWGLAKVLPAGGIEDEKQAHTKHKDISIIQTMRSLGSDIPGTFGAVGSPTQMGSVMGTPAYIAPEQALGEIDQMDERADVFGLGAILCEILTGKPPYVGDDSAAIYRMASRGKLDEAFQRLDDCGADAELIALTKDCLHLEPADRPRDAGVLAERVSGYLESVETKLRESEKQRAVEAARVEEERKRRHVLLALVAAVILMMGLGGSGWMYLEQQAEKKRHDAEATRLVQGLLQADTSQVKMIIGTLTDYREYATDDLKQAFAESPDDSNAKLHAALALLPEDDSVLPFLKERLLTVSPIQFQAVHDLLSGHKDKLVAGYWEIAPDTRQVPARRFQAACALASFDPENEHWQDQKFVEFMAGHLVGVLPSELLPWRNALRPVKAHLAIPLAAIYRDNSQDPQVRSFATDTLADYLSDDAEGLFDLLADANDKQFRLVFGKLYDHRETAIALGNAEVSKTPARNASEANKEALATRQANAAVMLLRMDAANQVWPLLKHSPDPRVRSYIIHWLSPRGGDARQIIARYEQETDVTIKRALLLCLGEFELDNSQKEPLIETLLTVYQNDPDAGLHAAAEWLLRQWKQGDRIAAIDKELQQIEEQLTQKNDKQQQWYINGQGQTFVILDAGEFQMGSPESEAGRKQNENQCRRTIGRRFAISTKEVTRGQWRVFSNAKKVWAADQDQLKHSIRTDDSPMVAMTWYEAAHYCNWLSEQEGIPKDQWCYEPNDEGQYGDGMQAREKFWELTGYRLPTEAEWEFACRAGTSSVRYYGVTEALLPRYAWFRANGETHTHPVASLKPNDFGLFDMQGNVYDWCYDDPYVRYPMPKEDEAMKDAPLVASVEETGRRVLRGGAFEVTALFVRSAYRGTNLAISRLQVYGFRPARTFPRPE